MDRAEHTLASAERVRSVVLGGEDPTLRVIASEYALAAAVLNDPADEFIASSKRQQAARTKQPGGKLRERPPAGWSSWEEKAKAASEPEGRTTGLHRDSMG